MFNFTESDVLDIFFVSFKNFVCKILFAIYYFIFIASTFHFSVFYLFIYLFIYSVFFPF